MEGIIGRILQLMSGQWSGGKVYFSLCRWNVGDQKEDEEALVVYCCLFCKKVVFCSMQYISNSGRLDVSNLCCY